MLKLLPCLDTDAMAAGRRRELGIPRDRAARLGRSAVEAAARGYYEHAAATLVDWRHPSYGRGTVAAPRKPIVTIPSKFHASKHLGA